MRVRTIKPRFFKDSVFSSIHHYAHCKYYYGRLIPSLPYWLAFLRRYFGISLTIKNKTHFIPSDSRFNYETNNFYVFVLYYPTPEIFLCGHSVHTGRLYSCFDSTGSSLRPKLSNCCFGSYSDIQLVCIDIKIDSHNYNYLPLMRYLD